MGELKAVTVIFYRKHDPGGLVFQADFDCLWRGVTNRIGYGLLADAYKMMHVGGCQRRLLPMNAEVSGDIQLPAHLIQLPGQDTGERSHGLSGIAQIPY